MSDYFLTAQALTLKGKFGSIMLLHYSLILLNTKRAFPAINQPFVVLLDPFCACGLQGWSTANSCPSRGY